MKVKKILRILLLSLTEKKKNTKKKFKDKSELKNNKLPKLKVLIINLNLETKN